MPSTSSSQSTLAKVAEYVEAITLDPSSKVFVPLAEIYREAGMLDAAVPLITKGIRANPEYGPGYIVLGRLFVTQEKLEEARKAFLKAVQLEGESLPAHKGLLKVLWRLENKDAARKTAEKILRLDPTDREAKTILASVSAPPAAHKPLQTAAVQAKAEPGVTPEGEEPIKTATLADIYVKQGLYQKALNLYSQILSRDPANQEIQRKAEAAQQQLQQQGQKTAKAEKVAEASTVSSPETSTEPTKAEMDPKEKLIAKLQGWLDSIQQRRGHVL